MKLWKHHAAQPQADRINALAQERGEPGSPATAADCPPSGSSPRACSCSRRTRRSTPRPSDWVEAADWIVWQLCGTYVRNACTAGYKAVYQDGRYPSREFLAALDKRFADFFDDKVEQPIGELGTAAGGLTAQAAALDRAAAEGIAVAVGNVDAHVTAPAAQSIDPGEMLMVMGTSTCHVMNGDTLAEVPGHVRRRRRAASPRACGATRPGRAVSATSSPGSCAPVCPPAYASGPPPRGSACTST